jgi:hypothetical protein
VRHARQAGALEPQAGLAPQRLRSLAARPCEAGERERDSGPREEQRAGDRGDLPPGVAVERQVAPQLALAVAVEADDVAPPGVVQRIEGELRS